jgi:hypothetical protein
LENRRLSLDVQIPVWTFIWKINVNSGRIGTGLDVHLENRRLSPDTGLDVYLEGICIVSNPQFVT